MAAQWSPPKDYENRPICVLGGGVLGRRIAACFVAAGHQVRIRDPSEKSRDDAVKYIKENISSFSSLLPSQPKREGSVEAIEDLAAAVKDCWMVFEAVPEILPLKESTFADLEKHAPSDCILATNSSSFKSGELLSKVKESTKTRVLNTHFMMPPQAIIVELMTSGHTSPEIFPFVEARHREAGLHPVTALKESSGFIFNRIWAAIKREVLSVLAEGVSTPEVIDGIWREQYNSPIGPCTMMDSVGLDTVEHIEQHYVDERGLPPKSLQWLQKNFIEQGKLGLKTDKGGLYAPPDPGSRTKILFLNLGLGEPLGNKSLSEIMTGGEILSITAEDRASKPIALVRNQAMPDGIDACEGRMYWTNMGNPSKNDGTVLSAKLDGSDVQTVIASGKVHTPKQLHIDQEAKKLYFCDREGLRVMRSNLDGSEHETLIQLGDWESEPEKAQIQSNWPVGITVSRKSNKFMWSQKGGSKASDGTIYAASLDLPAGSSASDRKDIEVIRDNLPECIDLEMDDEAGVLYWTSRGELPLGNTLNKKQITGEAPAAEKALGRQIVRSYACAFPLMRMSTNECFFSRSHKDSAKASA
jgi:3-hydroxyacyl-CoA dehydrogenase